MCSSPRCPVACVLGPAAYIGQVYGVAFIDMADGGPCHVRANAQRGRSSTHALRI